MEGSISADSRGSKSSGSKKRSKSLVAAVRSFFGRQLSIPPPTAEDTAEVQEDFDSSAKLEPTDSYARRQEQAWMQACYNAAALLFLFITGCILVAVYWVMEPFLHPLLWAVLVGMVLHPFKHMSTSGITHWLKNIRDSRVPLSVSAVFTPLVFFNFLSHKLERILVTSWKAITQIALSVIVLLVAYVLNLPIYIARLLGVAKHFLDVMESFLTVPFYVLLLTLAVGFLVLLLLTRGQSRYSLALSTLSSLLWFMLALNLTTLLLGSLAAPLVVILFATAAILSVTWKGRQDDESDEELYGKGLDSSQHSGTCESGEKSKLSKSEDSLYPEPKVTKSGNITTREIADEGVYAKAGQTGKTGVEEVDRGDELVSDSSSVSLGPTMTLTVPPSNSNVSKDGSKNVSPRSSRVSRTREGGAEGGAGYRREGRRSCRLKAMELKTLRAREQSNLVFIVLLLAYFVVITCKYPLIIVILSPLALWVLIRHAYSLSPPLEPQLCNVVNSFKSLWKEKAWLITPPPLPTLFRIYLYVDSTVLNLAIQGTGSLVSLFIIFGLVVGVVLGVVSLLLAVQMELAHYMNVGANVWNMTLSRNPQLSEWVNTTQSFDAFAKQSYEYGRAWLTQTIHSVVGDSSSSSLLEKQILQLIDSLYHSYFSQESEGNVGVRPRPFGPALKEVGSDVSGPLFAEIKVLIFDNFETFLSVLKSVWTIVTENISIAFSFLYALLELLFSGGSTLFNMIVFVSALFYLLSWSEERYLPVLWVMDLLPHLTPPTSDDDSDGGSKDQGEAFQRAMRGVFHASLRRAFFYGVYTWLIHTVVAVPVSILPSVMAGLAGAIPFVGPYWAALPSILELWLVEGSPLTAITLLVLALLPVLFVDTLINGEIEGGHPYLTGLAIAGGIYFAGLEGAMIGPILLCCLIFFVDIYGDIFSN